MTVSLIDKRRPNQRTPDVEMSNGTWFAVLEIPGMSDLTDTRKFCDTGGATPAKARKMAELVEAWDPPPGWASDDPVFARKMKGYIVDFLRECNGFRTQ